MKPSEFDTVAKPSREAVAEAAAWIARLHSSRRSLEVEAGFRKWLAADEEHARAFEGMNEIWDGVPGASTGEIPRVAVWDTNRRTHPWARAAVLVLACTVLSFGAYWFSDPDYTTGIGEQRIVNLQDGTRVSMNAGTRIAEKYSQAERRIVLKEGEAIFEVAKRPQWPFIVIVGDRQIRALGTTFVVRRDGQSFAVTLVEGKVAISPASGSADTGNQSHDRLRPRSVSEDEQPASNARREHALGRARMQDRAGDNLTLSPGERLTFAGDLPPKLDMPPVEIVTAWRRGEVILDETALADAIAEMNRYDQTQIVIDDPHITALRVSGIYRTGDSTGFAQIVARMYDLAITQEDGRIHLHERADRSPH